MTAPACVICGGVIPTGPNHTTRKTCSDACRLKLNAMRKRANRHAAQERKLEAAGRRVCAVCSTPILDTDSRRLTCGKRECGVEYDRLRRAARQKQKPAVTATYPTVRCRVTDLRTGQTRWEDRPLVPYSVSAARLEARRRGAEAAHAQQRAKREAEAIAAVLGEEQG